MDTLCSLAAQRLPASTTRLAGSDEVLQGAWLPQVCFETAYLTVPQPVVFLFP